MNRAMVKTLRRASALAGLCVAGIPFVFPFWWMATSALKTPAEMFAQLTLLPKTFRWENFPQAFAYQPFASHYVNSGYIAVVVTVATVLMACLSGYAFAKVRFPYSKLLFVLLLSGMMMPSEVTIIPNFFMMRRFGLSDSHLPVILLLIFGAQGAFAAFLMRQFFLTVPKELEEAAQIDGLSKMGIFLRIMLPLSMPAVGAASILTVLNAWNAFLEPLVFIDTLAKFTLPLSLSNFRDAYGAPLWHLQMAATTLSVLPILLFYVMAQRKITNAMVFSGLKG